jgi:membrane protein DedA with SNARE-associated domain
LEGLTVPCPSMFIVFVAGAILVDSLPEYLLLVAMSSTAYTLASLIPYYLGTSIQIKFFVKEKYWSMLERLFTLHGDKIVCYSRPLWIGNMVSYFAGLNRMKRRRFLFYTFLGIFPWHVLVMLTGRFFGSNIDTGIKLVQEYSWLAVSILLGFFVLTGLLKSHLEKRLRGKLYH